VDPSITTSEKGMWAIKWSFAGLAATALVQAVVVFLSGSVGLLADTIHNFADALTSIPLWIAFVVGRRAANRRYTYGYGRAEDVAGVVIVLIILGSAILAFWESVQKFLHPTPLQDVGWVMAAAVVGFLGNEGVSVLRIRTGRRIGSAALEADGYHARVDGLTSLGVLIGAIAVALGAPIADPIVGLLISVAILFVSRGAAVAMWRRIMDAVDPGLVTKAEQIVRETPGVQDVHDLRLRWSGHRLLADAHLSIDERLSLARAHAIGEEARHRLFHALPRLADVTVHLDPVGPTGVDYHALTEHHQRAP
jgi:cation diffusion facilitator family transporter